MINKDLQWTRGLRIILGEHEYDRLITDLKQREKDFKNGRYIKSVVNEKYYKRDEIIRKSIELLSKGLVFREAGEILNLGQDKIRGLLTSEDRDEITENRKKRRHQEQIDEANKLKERGYSIGAIAEVLKVDENTVLCWLKIE